MTHAFTASLPQREKTLRKAVASILPQVDFMQVTLNNYSHTPEFLSHPKITVIHHDNSMEDGSRFIGIEKAHGNILVFDDDIEYPPDYVQVMRDHCVQLSDYHEKPVIVCPMGKVLKPRPIKSYYHDIACSYKTFSHVDDEYLVDVPGACGVLWNSHYVRIAEDIIKTPNSDLCLAVAAKQKGALCIVVPHSSDWLKNLMPELPKNVPSIYGKYRRNDAKLTEFVNKWL